MDEPRPILIVGHTDTHRLSLAAALAAVGKAVTPILARDMSALEIAISALSPEELVVRTQEAMELGKFRDFLKDPDRRYQVIRSKGNRKERRTKAKKQRRQRRQHK